MLDRRHGKRPLSSEAWKKEEKNKGQDHHHGSLDGGVDLEFENETITRVASSEYSPDSTHPLLESAVSPATAAAVTSFRQEAQGKLNYLSPYFAVITNDSYMLPPLHLPYLALASGF